MGLGGSVNRSYLNPGWLGGGGVEGLWNLSDVGEKNDVIHLALVREPSEGPAAEGLQPDRPPPHAPPPCYDSGFKISSACGGSYR